jgi:hypothetical protein
VWLSYDVEDRGLARLKLGLESPFPANSSALEPSSRSSVSAFGLWG